MKRTHYKVKAAIARKAWKNLKAKTKDEMNEEAENKKQRLYN